MKKSFIYYVFIMLILLTGCISTPRIKTTKSASTSKTEKAIKARVDKARRIEVRRLKREEALKAKEAKRAQKKIEKANKAQRAKEAKKIKQAKKIKKSIRTKKSSRGKKYNKSKLSLKKPLQNPSENKRASSISSTTAYRLKPMDPIIITLRGIPQAQEIEDVIDEDGAINLPYIGRVTAAEKTSSELEQAIQRAYLEQQIYRHINVNVVIPSRSYYVRGEVKKPGRYQLISGVTIVQAIAAAGGYTDYANPRRVSIIRSGNTMFKNARDLEKRPEEDEDIESGDVIVIPRSVF